MAELPITHFIKDIIMATQFSVQVGTTNTDSTGSSANLTTANEILSQASTPTSVTATETEYKTTAPAAAATYLDLSTPLDEITVTADYWNATGQKEVSIDAVNSNVTLTNFVDVDVDLSTSDLGVSTDVLNAKRGQIETGSGDDVVNVSVQTNSSGWSNTFDIDTGAGNDTITMQNVLNSKYTMFDIDAGTGDDTIDVSSISANDSIFDSAYERSLLGGSGKDNITGSQGNDYIDGGTGADTIAAGKGNDIVTFDSNDISVDGGDGFDALVVSKGFSMISTAKFTDFEAIIGETGVENDVYTDLSDGLIVALGGGDSDDDLYFSTDADFALDTIATLDASTLTTLTSDGVDTSLLNAYTATIEDGSHYTVWTDVDLLA